MAPPRLSAATSPRRRVSPPPRLPAAARSLATTLLGSRAAAGGIAMINAITKLGAVFGPTRMGWSEAAGNSTLGLAVMRLTVVRSGVLARCVESEKVVEETS